MVLAARAALKRFYGSAARHSYFIGCSKGGQEGMVLAQREPDLFDGIVAAAPGFSLPRAAVAEAWDTQSFARVAQQSGAAATIAGLARSFSDDDLGLLSKAVLAVCDADDGVVDGMLGNFPACTSARLRPALDALTCRGAKEAQCLSRSQIDALVRVQEGARNGRGKPLYAAFPWDAGWSDPGWRVWKIGSADGRMPAINVAMGAPSLAMVFTVPPQLPSPGPEGALAYALAFDFDRDAPKIYATGGGFARSAWQDRARVRPTCRPFAGRAGS